MAREKLKRLATLHIPEADGLIFSTTGEHFTVGAKGKSITEPLTTVVAEGNHHGLVVPPAWILSYYQHGALASVAEPVSTVTTLERHALVTSEQTNEVNACGFRMLEPHEIQAAMAFPQNYVVTGTRREQVRQLGNAVTPPVMQMLISRCMAALA